MSLIRKHVAVLQAWACLALVNASVRAREIAVVTTVCGQLNHLGI